MFQRILNHRLFHITVTVLIGVGVFACVFPSTIPGLSWVVNYAVQLMLLYLFAGLAFLLLKQSRLTFAFFGGCVLLCFFLKYSVRADSIERWRQNMAAKKNPNTPKPIAAPLQFKVAHINLTNVADRSGLAALLNSTDADIISVHEVTPAWNQWLQDSLGQNNPYHHTLVDIGIYGMAVFSKYKLSDIDTFYYGEIPNLRGKLKVKDKTIDFLDIHTIPAFDNFSKGQMKEQLELVAKEMAPRENPVMVFGDFNAVSWSENIQHFLDKTELMESRVGFMPSNFSGKISLWDIPLDHIFYSGHLVCTDFQNISGSTGEHLGIIGTYFYPDRSLHDKEPSK